MRFLIDAQLPRRVVRRLVEVGHDAVHTLDLQTGNRTPDADIIAIADREERVVVTKDDDFVHSLLVAGRPIRLLLVTTGNIDNRELEQIFRKRLPDIVAALDQHRFVELGRNTLVIHD